jgi:predicted PurR-regulated permease PerM
MSFLRPIHLQTIAWAGVALALLALLRLLAPILAPFVLAAVFAYLCNPAVNALVRWRLPRPAAVLLVLGGLSLVLAMLLLVLLPMFYHKAISLAQKLPDLTYLFNGYVSPMLREHLGIELTMPLLGASPHEGEFPHKILHADPSIASAPATLEGEFQFTSEQIHFWIGQYRDIAQEMLPGLLKSIGHSGMAIAAILVNLALIPIVTFYLLQEWPHIIAGLARALPRTWLPHVQRVAADIDTVLAQFCRGQVSVMLLLAVYYSMALWLVGLEFALPIGVLTGLLIFIPYAGFCGGLALAVLGALLQFPGSGWEPLIGVAVVYTIGQLVESFTLTPYLVGDRIGLHPLVVIFALMAFGQLFGFVGILVALPVSAALLVGLRELASAWFASPVYLGPANTGKTTDPPKSAMTPPPPGNAIAATPSESVMATVPSESSMAAAPTESAIGATPFKTMMTVTPPESTMAAALPECGVNTGNEA